MVQHVVLCSSAQLQKARFLSSGVLEHAAPPIQPGAMASGCPHETGPDVVVVVEAVPVGKFPEGSWSRWGHPGERGNSLLENMEHLVPPGVDPPWRTQKGPLPVGPAGPVVVSGFAVMQSWAWDSGDSSDHARLMARCLQAQTRREDRMGALVHTFYPEACGPIPVTGPPPSWRCMVPSDTGAWVKDKVTGLLDGTQVWVESVMPVLSRDGRAFFWPVGPALADAIVCGAWPVDVSPVTRRPSGTWSPTLPLPNPRQKQAYLQWLAGAPEHALPTFRGDTHAHAVIADGEYGVIGVAQVRLPSRGYVHACAGDHHVGVLDASRDCRSLRNLERFAKAVLPLCRLVVQQLCRRDRTFQAGGASRGTG